MSSFLADIKILSVSKSESLKIDLKSMINLPYPNIWEVTVKAKQKLPVFGNAKISGSWQSNKG